MSRDLALISASLTTWGIGEGMFFLFQPLYLQELGANPVAIGSILGMIGLTMSIAHIPAGYFADLFGRRPLIISAWVFGMVATWVMAMATSLPTFILGSAMYGLTSFVMAPLNSYITNARGNWSLARTLTTVSAMYNLGAIVGPIWGGWIGERFGLRMNFFIAACLFILSTIIILFIRPQPTVHNEEKSVRSRVLGLLLQPSYLKTMGVAFLVIFSMYLPQPLSQNFLQNERGVPVVLIGMLIALRSLGVVMLNLSLGRLDARQGFLLAQVSMILSAFLLWKGDGLFWFAISYLLIGSSQTARALAIAQSQTLVDEANIGLAYGLLETIMSLSIILAPPLAGLIYAQEPSRVYPVSILCIILALMLSIRVPISPPRIHVPPKDVL